jgi:hypothetical protein
VPLFLHFPLPCFGYFGLSGAGFAPHHIAGGKKIHEQIDEAIRLHERLLLILSQASMATESVNAVHLQVGVEPVCKSPGSSSSSKTNSISASGG